MVLAEAFLQKEWDLVQPEILIEKPRTLRVME